MPPGAVRVAPAVVGGQQVAEGGEQVLVASGAELKERDPGGGVGDEDMEQTVAAALAGEVRTRGRDVLDPLPSPGRHLDLD